MDSVILYCYDSLCYKDPQRIGVIVYVRVPITTIVNHVCNNHIGFASKRIASHLVFVTLLFDLFLHNGKVIS